MIKVYKWEANIPEPFMIVYDDITLTVPSLSSLIRGALTLIDDDAVIEAFKTSEFVFLGEFNTHDDIVEYAKIHYPEDFV